jgi:hypothetical protein
VRPPLRCMRGLVRVHKLEDVAVRAELFGRWHAALLQERVRGRRVGIASPRQHGPDLHACTHAQPRSKHGESSDHAHLAALAEVHHDLVVLREVAKDDGLVHVAVAADVATHKASAALSARADMSRTHTERQAWRAAHRSGPCWAVQKKGTTS